jgi:hypothetical protein
VRKRSAVACGIAAVLTLGVACGESRRPIGEECLRDDDCLSNVCASRSCVAAPTLIRGATGTEPEAPRLPVDDAAAPTDAAAEAR